MWPSCTDHDSFIWINSPWNLFGFEDMYALYSHQELICPLRKNKFIGYYKGKSKNKIKINAKSTSNTDFLKSDSHV